MPTVGYQISVKLLYPLAAALHDEGLALDPLLASAEIPREIYERSDSRIHYLALRRFFHVAAATSRNRALGLAAARHVPAAQLQMLEYFAATSASVGAALQALVEYESVLTGGQVLSLEPRTEGVLLRVQPLAAGAHRSWFEFVVGSLYLSMRRFASPPVVRREPVIAWFAYTAHDAADDYRVLFDGRVRFGAPATGLLIPRSIMQRSLESVNAPLHDLLERSLSAIAKRESSASSFSDRVRTLLGESLAEADAGIDAIAARLHMSRSTLRRRLAQEGTTHRALLQEVREALALRYLERRELSLGEVSGLVGYDDPTSFQKAFKRWMGCTPAQHRARVHHDALRRTGR